MSLVSVLLWACNGGGNGSTTGDSDVVDRPAPTVASISPTEGPSNGHTTVTITGQNFQGNARVRFGTSAALSTTVVDATTITALTPPGFAGAVDVTVINPDGKSGSLPQGFTYQPLGAPKLTSIRPYAGVIAGGTRVQLTGTDFPPSLRVAFGGHDATNVLVQSSTTVVCSTPAGALGFVDVTVYPTEGSAATLAHAFEYRGLSDLTVSWANLQWPSSDQIQLGGTSQAIFSRVRIDNVTAAIWTSMLSQVGYGLVGTNPEGGSWTWVDSANYTGCDGCGDTGTVREYTANLTPADPGVYHYLGRYSLDGGGLWTYGDLDSSENGWNDPAQYGTLTVIDNGSRTKPKVTTIEPNVGPITGSGALGAWVTLTGTGFMAGATVSFGGVNAPYTIVVSATSAKVWLPPHLEGQVLVTITNPNGLADMVANGFNYNSGDCSAEPMEPFVFDGYHPQLTSLNPGAVKLAGDFTAWAQHPVAMKDDGVFPDFAAGDKVFALGIPTTDITMLQDGTYEYRFIADTTWVSDPHATEVEERFSNSIRRVKQACRPHVSILEPTFGYTYHNSPAALNALGEPAVDGVEVISAHLFLDHQEVAVDIISDVVMSVLHQLGHTADEGEHNLELWVEDASSRRSLVERVWYTIDDTPQRPKASGGYTSFSVVGNHYWDGYGIEHCWPQWTTLDGTWSRDPDGIGPSHYEWVYLDGPDGAQPQLQDQSTTAWEGYDSAANAIPPTTAALQRFCPDRPGTYTFKLTAGDDQGPSTNPDNRAETVVLPQDASSVKPMASISLNVQATKVVLTGSGGAVNHWYQDVRNLVKDDLNKHILGGALTVDFASQDGTYFYYLVAENSGTYSRPRTVAVTRQGGTLSAYDYSATPAWTRDAVVYEVFVREFQDCGDTVPGATSTWTSLADLGVTDKSLCGDGIGDLVGLTQRLPYLQDLGVNILWLMPIFESADHAHGYHTQSYYGIERDYGSWQDYQRFITKAHEAGMKVVLDLAINHVSVKHPLFNLSRDASSRFRNWFIWFDNSRTNYGFGRELGGSRLRVEDGWASIPDLNFGNPETRHYLFDVALHYLDPNHDGDYSDGADGLRLDHVTGPEHRVWEAFRREVKLYKPDAFLIAEVFRDFYNNDQGYGIKDYYYNEFDGVFTFPFFWAMEGLMNGDNQAGDLGGLTPVLDQMNTIFPVGALHMPFLENHDVPTVNGVFMTAFKRYGGNDPTSAGDVGVKRLKVSAALQSMVSGVPQGLYGQELGSTTFRGPMPWELLGSSALYNSYKELYHLRVDKNATCPAHPALSAGTNHRVLGTNGKMLALLRSGSCQGATESIVAVFNLGGADSQSISFSLSGTPASGAASLQPLLAGGSAVTVIGNSVSITLNAYGYFIGKVP